MGKFALSHPTAAFETKQWAAENFAQVSEHLATLGIQTVAVVSRDETRVLEQLRAKTKTRIITFDDLTLPEITALASLARLFVGNDSLYRAGRYVLSGCCGC